MESSYATRYANARKEKFQFQLRQDSINPSGSRPGGRTAPFTNQLGNKEVELREDTGFSSFHSGGCHFVFCDGHVEFLSENINQAVLEGMATRAGGESLSQ
jgi:prepilin-type processing-associated H-X9-DG protein